MSGDARGENEALFRKVNEQIEAISQSIPATQPTMDFLCECDDLDCHQKINATRAEYEAVRVHPIRFIVFPTHADDRVERVVSSGERFAVVEKRGAAARSAEDSDPRDGET